ncbi:MAG: GNAT family N-acetyltransferase [Pseudomonadota bacterium]
MSDAALRRAKVADAPACAAIVHGWLSSLPWMPSPQPSAEELSEIIAKGIPAREFWVIGAPVAGYLSFKEDENLVAGLYTAKPGSGAGKALLDRVKGGRNFVQLWTHEPNSAAHRFYHREGFRTVERKEEGRGDGVPELRMEWRA